MAKKFINKSSFPFVSLVARCLSLVAGFLLLVAPFPAFALITLENPLGSANIFQFIDRLIDVLFTIGLALAPIMILLAALQFLTSGGNPQRVAAAKNTILFALVGFAILLLAKGITNLICSFFTGLPCP